MTCRSKFSPNLRRRVQTGLNLGDSWDCCSNILASLQANPRWQLLSYSPAIFCNEIKCEEDVIGLISHSRSKCHTWSPGFLEFRISWVFSSVEVRGQRKANVANRLSELHGLVKARIAESKYITLWSTPMWLCLYETEKGIFKRLLTYSKTSLPPPRPSLLLNNAVVLNETGSVFYWKCMHLDFFTFSNLNVLTQTTQTWSTGQL